MVLTRRVLTVFLITLLVGLVPAAYADPPDPTWIGGFWDDDDFDTVVAFIASTFATFAQSDVDADPCLVWIDRAEPASPSLRSIGTPEYQPSARSARSLAPALLIFARAGAQWRGPVCPRAPAHGPPPTFRRRA